MGQKHVCGRSPHTCFWQTLMELILAFDADDTLWENERLFQSAQAELRQLLSRYHNPAWIDERLFATEMRNMPHYGYGIKAFTLSMIETAIELSEGRISGVEIGQIIDNAKHMLRAEIQLLPHVPTVLAQLAARHTLLLITKGDLLDQHEKLKRSGLTQYFSHVEVVANKREDDYARILTRHAIAPHNFAMVGNALKSDILPVLALGARAVFVPHALTWAHEVVARPSADTLGFYEIAHLGLLPALLETILPP